MKGTNKEKTEAEDVEKTEAEDVEKTEAVDVQEQRPDREDRSSRGAEQHEKQM